MSNDTTRSRASESEPTHSTVSGVVRLLFDLVAVSLWALFLTLLFLETAWPQWAFYGLLVAGVAVYVIVTAAWIRTDDER